MSASTETSPFLSLLDSFGVSNAVSRRHSAFLPVSCATASSLRTAWRALRRVAIRQRSVPDLKGLVSDAHRTGVMGDEYQRIAPFSARPRQQRHDASRGAVIEISGRFVCKNQPRIIRQGSGNRDALLLPSAELRRPMAATVGQGRAGYDG
jgi:hypothetical protein